MQVITMHRCRCAACKCWVSEQMSHVSLAHCAPHQWFTPFLMLQTPASWHYLDWGASQTWVQTLALPLGSYVTLGELLFNFSEPFSPCLNTGDDDPWLIELLGRPELLRILATTCNRHSKSLALIQYPILPWSSSFSALAYFTSSTRIVQRHEIKFLESHSR